MSSHPLWDSGYEAGFADGANDEMANRQEIEDAAEGVLKACAHFLSLMPADFVIACVALRAALDAKPEPEEPAA